jgi:hypothetical protein
MNAIIVTRRIDSAHLDLPELLAFVGKEVEIRICEATPPPPGTPDRWKPLWEAAGKGLIDEETYWKARAIDLADSEREALMWREIHAEQDANDPC